MTIKVNGRLSLYYYTDSNIGCNIQCAIFIFNTNIQSVGGLKVYKISIIVIIGEFILPKRSIYSLYSIRNKSDSYIHSGRTRNDMTNTKTPPLI